MDYFEYFQSYDFYFWQWEEDGNVIAIPGERTIAYREFVIEAYDKLSEQGVSGFGAFLLAVVATNPHGLKSLEKIRELVSVDLNARQESDLDQAMIFLNTLSQIPQQYKEGKKRILVFQAIFQYCHGRSSVHDARQIYQTFCQFGFSQNLIHKRKTGIIGAFQRDFATIALLGNRFKTVGDILQAVSALPEIKEEIAVLAANKNGDDTPEDFIESLIENDKTFYIGSLVRRIWGGLNIPVNSQQPSQQPLGGVSDLANKGDFDKLLISEYANDDLVLMSRLANNEALYLNREIPPANNLMTRIILIDVSLKNWGTPKNIAFATALAISKHPKTTISCNTFVLGDTFQEISFETIDSIIDGLQLLEGSLTAAKGLRNFFETYPIKKNREVFVITEASALKHAAVLKCLDDFQAEINYLIHPDAEGNIDVYKKQQKSKKHLQHIQLPLNELWRRPAHKGKERVEPLDDNITRFPILFRNTVKNKKYLSLADGTIFQVTGDKTLLRLYESFESSSKGWDLLCSGIPVGSCEYEIGAFDDGSVVLLVFDKGSKEILLVDIHTNARKLVVFENWKSTSGPCFVFYNQKFIHQNSKGTWTISKDGTIESNVLPDINLLEESKTKQENLQKRYRHANSLFRNIQQVTINQSGNLVFNIHELYLNSGLHIKLHNTGFKHEVLVKATRNGENQFDFDDGSVITLHRSGMLILRSSSPELPEIFVPTLLDGSLGLATDAYFAGNEYYFKEPLFTVKLVDAGKNKLETVKILRQEISQDLKRAKELVDGVPVVIVQSCTARTAERFQKQLLEFGAKVEILRDDIWNMNTADREKISTTTFFNNFIREFTRRITQHGTADQAI